MTSFNVFGADTTAETLIASEEGFISQNGSLSVFGGPAISVTGSSAVVINNGSLYATGNTLDILSSSFSLVNTGTISGLSNPIFIIPGANAANARIINSGVIQGGTFGSDAILIQSGGNEIINTGTLVGNSDDAIQIGGNFGTGTLTNRIVNSGVIIGGPADNAILLNFDKDTVINSGKIFGNISLGAGEDVYDGQQGTVAGRVFGGTGNDRLTGGDGSDQLLGDNDTDYLDGGAGGDHLWGGAGADEHWGGDGLDYARYDDANHGNVTASLANSLFNTSAALGDTYFNIEGLVGGAAGDTLYGDSGVNYLFGGDGADQIFGGDGNDLLFGDSTGLNGAASGGDNLWGGQGADRHFGGDGTDYARYDDANYGNLIISLADPTTNTGPAAGDSYISIEGLVGGAGADTVIGDNAANFLFGGGGADFIDGLSGADYLNGGAAADRFRFSTTLGGGNVDNIADFTHLSDDILLTASIFSSIGPALDATELRQGAAALDANDFIIYNSATGALSYDGDGSGAAAAIQFATVTAGTTLSFDDFMIV